MISYSIFILTLLFYNNLFLSFYLIICLYKKLIIIVKYYSFHLFIYLKSYLLFIYYLFLTFISFQINSEIDQSEKILTLCNQSLTYSTLFTPEIYDKLEQQYQHSQVQTTQSGNDWKYQTQSFLVQLRLRAISIHFYEQSGNKNYEQLIVQLEQLLLILREQQQITTDYLFPLEQYEGIFKQLCNLASYGIYLLMDTQSQQQFFNILLQYIDNSILYQQQFQNINQQNINCIIIYLNSFFKNIIKLSQQQDVQSYLKKLLIALSNRSGKSQEFFIVQSTQMNQKDIQYVPFQTQDCQDQLISQTNIYQLLWCNVLAPIYMKQKEFLTRYKSLLVAIFNQCPYHTNNDKLNNILPYNECFNKLTGVISSDQIKTPFTSIIFQKPIENYQYLYQQQPQIKVELLSIILNQQELNSNIIKEYLEPDLPSVEKLETIVQALSYAFIYQKSDSLYSVRNIVCQQQKSYIWRQKNQISQENIQKLQQIMIKYKLFDKIIDQNLLSKECVKNFLQLILDSQLWLQFNNDQYTNFILFLLKYLEDKSVDVIKQMNYNQPTLQILIQYLYDIITEKIKYQSLQPQQYLDLQELPQLDIQQQCQQFDFNYFNRFVQQKQIKLQTIINVISQLLQSTELQKIDCRDVFIIIICQIYTGIKVQIDQPIIQLINQVINQQDSIIARWKAIKQQLLIMNQLTKLQDIQQFLLYVKQLMGSKQFVMLCEPSYNLKAYGYFNTILLSEIYISQYEEQQQLINLFIAINAPYYIARYLIVGNSQEKISQETQDFSDMLPIDFDITDGLEKQIIEQHNKHQQDSENNSEEEQNEQQQKDDDQDQQDDKQNNEEQSINENSSKDIQQTTQIFQQYLKELQKSPNIQQILGNHQYLENLINQQSQPSQLKPKYNNQKLQDIINNDIGVTNSTQQQDYDLRKNMINTSMVQIPPLLLQAIFTLKPSIVTEKLSQYQVIPLKNQSFASSYNQHISPYNINQILINAICIYEIDYNCEDQDKREELQSNYKFILNEAQSQSQIVQFGQINEGYNLLVQYLMLIAIKYQNYLDIPTYEKYDLLDRLYQKIQLQNRSYELMETYQKFMRSVSRQRLSYGYVLDFDLSNQEQISVKDVTQLMLHEWNYNEKSIILLKEYENHKRFEQLSYIIVSFYLQRIPNNIYNPQSILNDLRCLNQTMKYIFTYPNNQLKTDIDKYKTALIQTLKFLLQKVHFTNNQFNYQLLQQTIDSIFLIMMQGYDSIDVLKCLYTKANYQKLWLFSIQNDKIQDLSLALFFLVDPILYLQLIIENTFTVPKIASNMILCLCKVLTICETQQNTIIIKETITREQQLIKIILLQKETLYKTLFNQSNQQIVAQCVICNLYINRLYNQQKTCIFPILFMKKLEIKYNKNYIFNEILYKDYVTNIVKLAFSADSKYQDNKDIQQFIQLLCSQKIISPYISELIVYVLSGIKQEVCLTSKTLKYLLKAIKQLNPQSGIVLLNVMVSRPMSAKQLEDEILPFIKNYLQNCNKENIGQIMTLLNQIYQSGIKLDQYYLDQLIRYKLKTQFNYGLQILMQDQEHTFRMIIQQIEAQNKDYQKLSFQEIQKQFISLYDEIQKISMQIKK